MIEALLVIAGLLGLAIAGMLVAAARRPDRFAIQRSADIAAPPAAIYPMIADLRALNTWNPFNADPGITGTYSGPEHGVGANYAVASRKSGTGHITIVDTDEPRRATMRLVMTKPFACDNQVEYRLEPRGDVTRVTWAMSGRSSFVSRVMCLFMDPDKMCGDMFLKGLADLKSKVETRKAA